MQGKDATVVEETSPPMITKEEYADLVCMLRSSKKTNNHHKENMSGKNIPKAYMTSKIKNLISWIIESGAREHITPRA